MKIFLVIIAAMFSCVLLGQTQGVVVKGELPKLYILHVVGPNETFESIAADYNLTATGLAEYNNIDFYSGHVLAKTVRVPLTPQNFIQKVEGDNSRVPVVHVVDYNENLLTLSNKYKVPMATLNKWNTVSNNHPVLRSQVVVGFIRDKNDTANLVAEPTKAPVKAVPASPTKEELRRRSDSIAAAKLAIKLEEQRKIDEAIKEKKRLADIAAARRLALEMEAVNEKKRKDLIDLAIKAQQKRDEQRRIAEAANEKRKNDSIAAADIVAKIAEKKRKLAEAAAERKRQDSIAIVAAAERVRREAREKKRADSLALVLKNDKIQKAAEAEKEQRRLEAAASAEIAAKKAEKRRQDSLAIEEGKERARFAAAEKKRKLDSAAAERRRLDLTATAEANERARLAAEEKQRKEEAETRRLDSIADEKHRLELIATAEANERARLAAEEKKRRQDEAIAEKKRKDSLATAEANEKARIAAEEKQRLIDEADAEKKRLDSLALAAKAEKKRKQDEAAAERKRLDAIAIAEGKERARLQAAEKKRADSIALATQEGRKIAADKRKATLAAAEKKRLDSLAAAAKKHAIDSVNALASVKPPVQPIITAPIPEAGFFETSFTEKMQSATMKEKSGAIDLFQSQTGWDDKKYYALVNGVVVGTVLKVMSPGGKIVYAKVLGPLPQHPENAGLLLRISDAAAAALGLSEDSMGSVIINY